MSKPESLTDPDVTITLPLSAWGIVMANLGRGPFCETARVIYLIGVQSDPQLQAASAAARAKAQEPAPDPAPDARSLN